MAVGPDVYQAHKEDTERYVLTNLNMVSVPWGPGPLDGASHKGWHLGTSGHSATHQGLGAEWEGAGSSGSLNLG